jgi:hypothetical protein
MFREDTSSMHLMAQALVSVVVRLGVRRGHRDRELLAAAARWLWLVDRLSPSSVLRVDVSLLIACLLLRK